MKGVAQKRIPTLRDKEGRVIPLLSLLIVCIRLEEGPLEGIEMAMCRIVMTDCEQTMFGGGA